MQQHRATSKKSQARYKRNFDQKLRNQTHAPEAGSFVYIRRDYGSSPTEDQKSSRKLAPKADGPYFIKEILPTVAAIQIDDRVEYVSFDRISPAPAPIYLRESGPSSSLISSRNDNPVTEEHVVRTITEHRLMRMKGVSKKRLRYEFSVLCYDGGTTWELIVHIPTHFVTEYCKRTSSKLPVDIDKAQVGWWSY